MILGSFIGYNHICEVSWFRCGKIEKHEIFIKNKEKNFDSFPIISNLVKFWFAYKTK